MKRKTNRSPIDIFRGQSGGGNYGLSALLACLLAFADIPVCPPGLAGSSPALSDQSNCREGGKKSLFHSNAKPDY